MNNSHLATIRAKLYKARPDDLHDEELRYAPGKYYELAHDKINKEYSF